jgi:hypothetical protein
MSLSPQWGILWVGTVGYDKLREQPGGARSRGGNRLPFGDQETVGGDAHDGVMVKASPSASFEMPEADLLLEFLIVALDAPAQLGGVDQIAKRNASLQGREPIFGGLFLALGPLNQQPLLRWPLGTLADIFTTQASAISGATINALTVTVTQNGLTRTATISYTGSSANSFPSILKQAAWPLSGSATASATVAPNIDFYDFYMLLDNSPSMAIAATTAGINTMIANTPQQDNGAGCAFGCHQSSPNSGGTPGNTNGQDNYTLAKSLGVVTRIQNVAVATQTLTSTAASLATQTGSAVPDGSLHVYQQYSWQ